MTPRTDPPADAVLPKRSPHAPAPGTVIGSHYRECFGCGDAFPNGLRVRVEIGEGLALTSRLNVGEHLQGAPGLAHGGILMAAMDEAMGALNYLLAVPAVTGHLETDFVRPVPVGSTLVIDARIVGVAGRKVYTSAVACLGDDGPVAVKASALFVQVPLEHFASHGNAEQISRAVEERRARGTDWVEVNP